MDSSLELYQTLLAKKRLRGLDDLYFFNKNIVETNPDRRKFLVPHVHGEWANWYKQSKARIKLILVPRATFKSTFFTVGKTLQDIARNRDERILIANATQTNAQNFLFEIKDHLTKNQTFLELYTNYKGKDTPFYNKRLRWNENEIELDGRSLGIKEATISTIGVGGNLVSQHYSRILADDLVNLENSATRYQALKVIDWWKKAFSLLDYDGEMVVIGTRWSYFELYSWMLEQLGGEIDYYIRGAYKEDGSLYFPEVLNEQKLQELRKIQGSFTFSSFYLNNPIDEETAIIKKHQIRYYGDLEEKSLPKNLAIFSVCDPAVSQQESADYSSIVTVGVDYDDNWYVLEVFRGQWSVGELVLNLFSTFLKWKPITMSIEIIGQAQALMNPIYAEEDKRLKEGKPVYLPLVEVKSRPPYTKEMRIRSVLQPRFERGKIFIRRDMADLEEELLRFPKSAHDDIIDPLTDLEEIGFTPNKVADDDKQGELESQTKLRPVVYRKTVVDETMGENF